MIDRRTALLGLAAGAALPAFLPASGRAAPRRRAARPLAKPRRLREGDVIGLIAPAGYVESQERLDRMLATIASLGLVPKLAPNLLHREGYFAGPDRERAASVDAMFADPEVRAIIAVAGGWGCQRILPYLDFALIDAHPKLLIGSSDITALHLALAARTHCPSIHGPNAAHSWGEGPRASFRSLAFDAAAPTIANPPAPTDPLVPNPWPIRTLRPGKARGRLLGGNLSVLSSLVGTRWLPSFTGAILFLEDTNEAEYRIDRMLTQLAQAGILGRVAGVVFGQCTNCRNPVPGYTGLTIDQVIEQHLAPLGVPAFQGAQIGHIAAQVSLPVGAQVEIDAGAGSIRVLAPIVG
ncbi:MAG: LD-carboxypeptidase [Novosphingobium sp.]